MAFPTSPSNNDVHKEGNRAFVYDSTLGTWDQVRETDRTGNKILSGEISGAVTGTLGSGITGGSGLDALVGVGFKNASIWRGVGSDLSGDASPYTQLTAYTTPSGYGILGSNMSQSSGVFTFPQTGYWFIMANWVFLKTSGTERGCSVQITTTDNNSTFVAASWGGGSITTIDSATTYITPSCFYIFDVTNTGTHKVRFDIDTVSTTTKSQTSTNQNRCSATFLRLGDT